MDEPGAKMSTHEPKFEYEARVSVESVAPTVMADGALAGDAVHASAFELPAATTTVMPLATARATASFIDALDPPPRLMLRTAGPDT